jgi:hypothetical protein
MNSNVSETDKSEPENFGKITQDTVRKQNNITLLGSQGSWVMDVNNANIADVYT